MEITGTILKKLESMAARFDQLEREMASASGWTQEKLKETGKEYNKLGRIVSRFREFKKAGEDIESCRKMAAEADDAEMKEMCDAELGGLGARLEEAKDAVLDELAGSDDEGAGNVILEIRAGAGGNEASLFAGVLYRMYSRFADGRKWRVENISAHPTDLGGFKEIVFAFTGAGAYRELKYESGVHRVQRIPVTEAGGRIHTSTVTVAVLLEPDEVEVEVNPADLRVDTFRASSAGGQHVNKTESAIRITHIPSGLVVECQDERSQHQNRAKAMRFLRARLLQQKQDEQQAKIAGERKSQVGTGDRSERIRTYNFPQGRVSDHRISLTIYSLDRVIEGELDDLLKPLGLAMQAKKLEAIASET